jgi:hypothetical protein
MHIIEIVVECEQYHEGEEHGEGGEEVPYIMVIVEI